MNGCVQWPQYKEGMSLLSCPIQKMDLHKWVSEAFFSSKSLDCMYRKLELALKNQDWPFSRCFKMAYSNAFINRRPVFCALFTRQDQMQSYYILTGNRELTWLKILFPLSDNFLNVSFPPPFFFLKSKVRNWQLKRHPCILGIEEPCRLSVFC